MDEKIVKPQEEWKKILTPEQYHICRQGGTERPFTGKYLNCDEKGIYKCVCCGLELFHSGTKFESGSGWPSFFEPIDQDRIEYKVDYSFGMKRTEALCKRCGSHLGHVFEDVPTPTGQRY